MTKTLPLPGCTRSFIRVYGVPCAHVLDEKITAGIKLEIEDFSLQWWIYDVHWFPVISEDNEFEFARIRNISNAGENAANSILADLRVVGNTRNVTNPAVPATKRSSSGSI